jgi:hypothetical protein
VLHTGGAGGAGAVLIGSLTDDLSFCGSVEAFGGHGPSNQGGNGELVIDSNQIGICTLARLNGLALLDSAQHNFFQLNDLPVSEFALSGGAGGAGAGGNGQVVPEASTWLPVSTGILGLVALGWLRRPEISLVEC